MGDTTIVGFISKYGVGNQTKFKAELADLLHQQELLTIAKITALAKGPKIKLVYKVIFKTRKEITVSERTLLSEALKPFPGKTGITILDADVNKHILVITVSADQLIPPKTVVSKLRSATNNILAKKEKHQSFWIPDYALLSVGTEDMQDLVTAFCG